MALGHLFNKRINKYLFMGIFAAPVVVALLTPPPAVETYSLGSEHLTAITSTSEAKIEAPVGTYAMAAVRADEQNITTTTSTTVVVATAPPPVPSRHPADKACPQWMELARQVGWAEENLADLSYVIWRESRCNHDSYNPDDPMTGSRGLTQVNGFWCLPNKYNPDGWLQRQNIGLTTCDDLFDPAINLKAALAIFNRSGWSPWAYM